MKSGIYSILNIINDKRYIGLTNNFSRRKDEHFRDLINGKHDNEHLQKAWSYYGEDSFLFEILENCECDKLIEREHHWCSIYNTHNDKYGYNIMGTNGINCLVVTPSIIEKRQKTKRKLAKERGYYYKEEYIKERSLRLKGRQLTPEHIDKIREKAKGNKYHLGHKFSEESKSKMSESAKKRGVSPQIISNLIRRAKEDSSHLFAPVLQYDLDGNFIKEWRNMKDAAKATNQKTYSNISSCCNRKRSKAGGFKWEYK